MKRIRGIIYAMVSAIAFGFMPIFAKLAYKGGASTVTVVFLRFFLAAFMLLIYLTIKHVNLSVKKEQLLRVIYIGVIGYSATCLTLYLSYEYMSVGLATTIHFVYPSIVAIIAFAVFKEKLGFIKVISLILSGIGLYVLIGFGEARLSMVGAVLAFVSGLLYSIYILEIGHSSIKNMDSIVLTFYICLFSSVGILLYGTATKTLNFNINAYCFLSSAAIAFVCTVFAIIAFSRAVQLIGSSNSAVLSTLEPITSIVLGVFIFGEKLSFAAVAGSILIIVSVALFCFPDTGRKGLLKWGFRSKHQQI